MTDVETFAGSASTPSRGDVSRPPGSRGHVPLSSYLPDWFKGGWCWCGPRESCPHRFPETDKEETA